MPIPIFLTSSTASSTLFNPITSNYLSYLVSVCGGSTYICTPGYNPLLAANITPSTTTLSTGMVGMAAINQNVYIVDGSSTIFQLNLSTLSMQGYSTTTGTAPTFCNLAVNWRARLVLAGDANNPQNFYMARTNDPTDWNYAATDASAAVAGNLAAAGQIGEPIVALIPYTDDYFVFGCAHSVWMLAGDLTQGGTITRLSEQMGIAGPRAWTMSPDGTIWFVASGGLHRLNPLLDAYKAPTCVTLGLLNAYFGALGWNTHDVSLAWDVDLHYLYIFATPLGSVTQSTGPSTSTTQRISGDHLVYDSRGGGLWFQRYIAPEIGPTCAVMYTGDNTPGSRALLLGSWDGWIRLMDQGAFTDDGSTIAASITLGPYKSIIEQGALIGATIDLGELYPGDASSTWHAIATFLSGPTAYDVTEGIPFNAYAVECTQDGRQKTFRQKLSGGWFSLILSNTQSTSYFSFESAMLEFDESGRNRYRR